MRFGDDITKRIISELEKVPNVRYVCSKVGLDHSTFYRWMNFHPTFNVEVLWALKIGREATNDAAEAVIIGGIQNKDMGASKFWLTHNSERFMHAERQKAHHDYMGRAEELLEYFDPADESEPQEGTFEWIFQEIEKYEKKYGFERAWKTLKAPLTEHLENNEQLIEVCKAAYLEWKKKSD